jgi:NhaA family Na+:H+ antiporter
MSLFIGVLAFPNTPEAVEMAKLGTLAGSLLSALLGFAILRLIAPGSFSPEDAEEAGEIFSDDDEDVPGGTTPPR